MPAREDHRNFLLIASNTNQFGREEVGHYDVSGEPAYRQYADVCVIAWPRKTALGMHSVVVTEPALSRQVDHASGYADPAQPVADWIKSLPRAE